MTETLTEGAEQKPASTEPTGQPSEQQQPAESQNQEANPGVETQGSASDDTAKQTETKTEEKQGGDSTTDEGLAKFAKSQGFDLETASDDVKRALKIAHDNQKAFRTRDSGKTLVEATNALAGDDINAEVKQLKYQMQTRDFFSQEGKDPSLEPKMLEILKEKSEQFGKDFAFNLSRDLDTLYGMAQLKSGAGTAPVDAEAIRREERESINNKLSASSPEAHATTGQPETKPTVTVEWIRDVYDPRNPEHIKIMQEAGLR